MSFAGRKPKTVQHQLEYVGGPMDGATMFMSDEELLDSKSVTTQFGNSNRRHVYEIDATVLRLFFLGVAKVTYPLALALVGGIVFLIHYVERYL